MAEVFYHYLDKQTDAGDGERRFKDLGEIFHQIWLATIVDPQIPSLQTAKGDPVVFVTVRFDVLDEQRARSALNAEAGLQRDGEAWNWVAGNSLLGTIKLTGLQLTLETQSEPRAERGRRLLESTAQDAIASRTCDRVDVREEVRKDVLSKKRPEAPPDEEPPIPRKIQDQLFQEYMAKHNQHWLDDQIPALDQQTPRSAAGSSTLRPRLVGLLKDIENQYLDALAAGEPAFDPTWMWDELGLADHQDAPRVRHPVWLAHESMEQHLPGITQAIRFVAEPKSAAGKDLVRTAVMQEELRAETQVQEFIRNWSIRTAIPWASRNARWPATRVVRCVARCSPSCAPISLSLGPTARASRWA